MSKHQGMVLAKDGWHLSLLTPVSTLWVWAREFAVPVCQHSKPAVWLRVLDGQSARGLWEKRLQRLQDLV